MSCNNFMSDIGWLVVFNVVVFAALLIWHGCK